MPNTLAEQDQDRLESLCMLFGVGLVLFDLNKDAPDFSIRVRAQRFSPDMFYVNEFAERLKLHDSEVFERLFAWGTGHPRPPKKSCRAAQQFPESKSPPYRGGQARRNKLLVSLGPLVIAPPPRRLIARSFEMRLV